jgi:hypothetical protein
VNIAEGIGHSSSKAPNSAHALFTTPRTPGQAALEAKCAGMLVPMSPPRKHDGQLADLDDIVTRIGDDGFIEDYNNSGENMKILIFLFGREYFKDYELRRKADIKKMLEIDLLAEGKAKNTPRQRILTVIEHKTDLTETLVEKFKPDMWKELIVAYGKHTIFDISNIEMVQRIQRSGNCFLNASTVLQGYLVQKDEPCQACSKRFYVREPLDVHYCRWWWKLCGSSHQYP